MEDKYYIDQIIHRNDVIFRKLAKGKNMIHHKEKFEWFMTNPRGGIERIFGVHLDEENANDEIAKLIKKIKLNLAPNTINITVNSTPCDIEDRLMSSGFKLCDSKYWGYGMAMDLHKMNFNYNISEKIKVKRVNDNEDFEYWINIINKALFCNEWFNSNDFKHLYKEDDLILYVAYYDGEPAGISSACFDKEVADINFIATLDKYRKKGIATAAMLTALKEMQQIGVRTATLGGDYLAVPLYEKTGFKIYCEFKLYKF